MVGIKRKGFGQGGAFKRKKVTEKRDFTVNSFPKFPGLKGQGGKTDFDDELWNYYKMKIQLALFITLLRLFVSIPQASSGVCPVLACSSQVSSTTCIQPVSPPSIYTFFNCASGGYSCGVLAADGDYFLDVPSGS